ncbi:MAG: hypothetical protein EBS82_03075 [Methylocystaceae bacterium]|nr:hypothetical protein [Methylocystaceae bacterium]
MSQKVSICLLGPKGAGKSSLLGSLADCVGQGAFGYSPNFHPVLQPISQVDFLKGPIDRHRADFLTHTLSPYERLKQELVAGASATNTLDTYEYYFRLSLSGAAPTDLKQEGPWLLEIIDSAGDIAMPPEGAQIALLDDVKTKLAKQILASDAIVLALPLTRFDEVEWSGALSRLADRIMLAKEKNLKRFVVALTFYERLFVNLGPDAFTYACDPSVARHVLRKSLRSSNCFDHIRKLMTSNSALQLRFTVCSTFGFTKRFQNPNLDPWLAGEQRFRRNSLEGARAYSEYWRPFLTAEPFLYAALGLDSAFTFSFDQLDGEAAPRFAEPAIY